ncbi:uncharacterized protein NPIL_432581 [Nephila pilipes]|uniref:Uncharacterized protein n=1 Tax=Nephila pilipes TaxID=299642 RepID=A0A8X6NEZ9_NEPPI|nr:uncharacterized protein NPIL_432581 [Nephila pilipes]
MTVRDIIILPHKTDPYAQLKTEIISQCGESNTPEICLLLAGEQLRYCKPSEFLKKSSEIADKILDISPIEVSAISDSCLAISISPDSELLTEIRLLLKEVALLRRSRSHFQNRQLRFRQKSLAVKDEQCWYHGRYVSKAVKCISPCNYPVNSYDMSSGDTRLAQ